jgi:hypothetical protein
MQQAAGSGNSMGVEMQRCAAAAAVTGSVRRNAALAAFALAALLAHSGSARAALYKWVDDQGVVHYTDKVPPEAINKGNIELNKQGVPLKKTEPALSPEQVKAKALEDERKRVLAKQQEDVARRDRALLASYTSENEIDFARARALQTVDNVIQSAQAYIAGLNKRKDFVLKKKAAAGDNPPPDLARELAMLNGEIERQTDLVAQKKREAATVNAKYDVDKQRWRELVAARAATAEPVTITQPEEYPGTVKKK